MSNEATRKTLIKCMNKLVRENPFSRISIEDICSMAHVSRRTFYRYFSDKYDILAATYFECFFSKIDIRDDDTFWSIFAKVCLQIYSEKSFFSHAIGVKGQNGFWEETKKLLFPYMCRDYPITEDIQDTVHFYIYNDLDVLFQLIERWIHDDFVQSPEKFSAFAHDSFKVHGRWVYEAATGRPRTEYAQHKIDSGEW
ncbi:MAG: TetR family transcriptional regulator [Mogibacterium sp.]|nr:TetR family transcriptional regulator [Mogibacterium sp.]